ncbi:MAG: helix-turn-helix domain-containing protein [Bdellovibrio sp.]
MNKEQIGEEIRRLRKEKGFRQDDLCAKAGVSIRVIKDIEAGKGNPTLDSLNSILSVLGVGPIDIFKTEKPKEIKTVAEMPVSEFLNLISKKEISENDKESIEKIKTLNSLYGEKDADLLLHVSKDGVEKIRKILRAEFEKALLEELASQAEKIKVPQPHPQTTRVKKSL